MQTFLPFSDFKKSASILDSRRLGKQRVEAKQILSINLAILNSSDYQVCLDCGKYSKIYINHSCEDPIYTDLSHYLVDNKIPWENHPAVLMWRGYEEALAYYGIAICSEWIKRGFKDNLLKFFGEYLVSRRCECSEFGYPLSESCFMTEDNPFPDWLGNKQFHLSHQSNLIRKDSSHYKKYFPDVSDNLPYYWPTKEGY